MRALVLVVATTLGGAAWASDDPCASRAAQCLASCRGEALCVARCSRSQATCERNRGGEERIALPRKCFDAMGAVLRCDSSGPTPVALDAKQVEALTRVAKVTLTTPWKDEARSRSKAKVIEVR